MKSTKPQNIDEYIAGFPKDIQKILKQIRETVQKAAPEAEEAIKYGMPTFVLNGNLVSFAAYKNHIGFTRCHPEKQNLKKILLPIIHQVKAPFNFR